MPENKRIVETVVRKPVIIQPNAVIHRNRLALRAEGPNPSEPRAQALGKMRQKQLLGSMRDSIPFHFMEWNGMESRIEPGDL